MKFSREILTGVFRTNWGDAVKFMDIKKAEQSFQLELICPTF